MDKYLTATEKMVREIDDTVTHYANDETSAFNALFGNPNNPKGALVATIKEETKDQGLDFLSRFETSISESYEILMELYDLMNLYPPDYVEEASRRMPTREQTIAYYDSMAFRFQLFLASVSDGVAPRKI
jgi:hypothetical protein